MARAPDEDARVRRRAALESLRRKPILLIDGETGRVFGEIAAGLVARGRGADFRVQDVWLASQAIQYGHRLLTTNERDFRDIPGLDLVVIRPPGKRPAGSRGRK